MHVRACTAGELSQCVDPRYTHALITSTRSEQTYCGIVPLTKSCCNMFVHRISIRTCLELAEAVAFDARNAVRKGAPATDPGVAKEQLVLR